MQFQNSSISDADVRSFIHSGARLWLRDHPPENMKRTVGKITPHNMTLALHGRRLWCAFFQPRSSHLVRIKRARFSGHFPSKKEVRPAPSRRTQFQCADNLFGKLPNLIFSEKPSKQLQESNRIKVKSDMTSSWACHESERHRPLPVRK